MNADVVIHTYDSTPIEAVPAGVDVSVRIGDVRLWLPRDTAQRLHAALGEALAANADQVP